MKFYICHDSRDQIIGCEMSLASAKSKLDTYGCSEGRVEMIDAEVSTETIRRLLGGIGGYARIIKWYDN